MSGSFCKVIVSDDSGIRQTSLKLVREVWVALKRGSLGVKPDLHFSSEGDLIFTDHGRILSASPMLGKLFGYNDAELLTTDVHALIPGLLKAPGSATAQVRSSPSTGLHKERGEFILGVIMVDRFQSKEEYINIARIDLSRMDHKELTPVLPPLTGQNQSYHLVSSMTKEEVIIKNLQQQIQRRKAVEVQLMKLQRLYETMVHNFPDGIIGVLNKNLEYTLVAGKELHEIDFPALGLTGNPSTPQDPDQAAMAVTQIKRAFKGDSVSFEITTKNRNYSISAVPLPDEQNHINEILCVMKNVTERKQMEDNLMKSLEKEKELGELKSRFVTMASHEFKTPLSTILSSAFLLENYAGDDFMKEKLVHIARIKRSVNNLTMILNEILSLEKLNENKVKVKIEEIDLPRYLQDIVSEGEGMKKQGQTIRYTHTGAVSAFLDPNLLWSILTNLISNALKYSAPGSEITVSSEIREDQVSISVLDYGIGIPENEHTHIFERFYRARNTLNIEGTGIGLHIVHHSVKLLNGDIFFTSDPVNGTKFTAILPNRAPTSPQTHETPL